MLNDDLKQALTDYKVGMDNVNAVRIDCIRRERELWESLEKVMNSPACGKCLMDFFADIGRP